MAGTDPPRYFRCQYSVQSTCALLRWLGFDERIKGSHHIFTKDGIPEILNLQPKNAKAKPYQVRQVRNLIVEHRLAGENDV